MNVALLFPGQGAQTPGFLHTLPEIECVQKTLVEASNALGFDVLSLDSEPMSRGTVAVQLSLLIAGTAFARFVHAEKIVPVAAAGMSVGAFAAAVAASALAFADALQFVKWRAELMEQAFPDGTHGLAVVEGLQREQLELLLVGRELVLANENALAQFVVVGQTPSLHTICAVALQAGAHRAELLQIGVPSHTVLLQPAAETLSRLAMKIAVSTPAFPLFANRTARPLISADKLREDLTWNMAAPVMWRDIMSAMGELGVDLFLEAPPGHTLGRLAHVNLPEVAAMSAADTRWDVLAKAARRTVR